MPKSKKVYLYPSRSTCENPSTALIRVIKHIRKVYGCRGCESAPVTAGKPVQLIEQSMASPSVVAMLLTTK
ncbi:transposase [Pseudomonas sp. TE12234]